MVDTTKHLYILPDVAYLVELLPTKKEHTFTVHNFRQINGDFITEDVFVEDNVAKLFGKIDPDEYHLVLPDFLFTSVIVQITETADTKIKSYLDEHLLPSLTLTKDSHHIQTMTLTQYGQKSRLQLSAIEKSLLNPVAAAHQDTDVKIAGISPLSWMLKSSVSLEPSVTIAQLGGYVYLALQYIGVDQTNFAQVEEADNLIETVKTLKGAEPSLQTVYLLTNELVEERLAEKLSDTLPVQQLVSGKGGDDKLPAYVRHIIEAGAKTSSVGDYNLPVFPVGKPVEDSGAPVITSSDRQAVSQSVTDADAADEAADTPLPPPSVLPTDGADTEDKSADAADEPSESVAKPEEDVVKQDEETAEPDQTDRKESAQEQSDEDLSQFAPGDAEAEAEPAAKPQERDQAADQSPGYEHPAKPVIKNQPGISSMLKMIFISLAVFFATIAIGIGLGLGAITFTQGGLDIPATFSFNPFRGDQAAETAQQEPTPSPEPTPEPEPSPEPEPVNVSELRVLVVNATTTPGLAGNNKDKLEDAEFGEVTAANAQGDYEQGNFVLMAEEDEALIDELEAALGLELEFSDQLSQEDSAGEYDAVVVLAE